MIGFNVNGGSFVIPFDIKSKDQYVQCVADIGKCKISIAPISDETAKVVIDGKEITLNTDFEIELREDGYGYVTNSVEIYAEDGTLLRKFTLATLKPAPNVEALYGAKNRPQFHYTAPYGYLNDPNGLVYDATKKEYHFFYQSNPYKSCSGPKHWGHAVSKDLVSFTECKTALYPDDSGAMWSGTAIIDYNNTAKLYDDTIPPEARILLVYYAYSDIGANAGLAYTPDGGKTWIKAENGRKFKFYNGWPGHIDPKVIWHEDTKKWVMFCATGDTFTSEDLWNWYLSGSDIFYECPDIYKIQTSGTDEVKFVRTYGGTTYKVGDLKVDEDGNVSFVSETDHIPYNGNSLNRNDEDMEQLLRTYGWYSGKVGSVYATQHYAYAPDDRIISVSWLIENGLDKTLTWAGTMSVAVEQKLIKKSNGEYLLLSYPVREIESLHGDVLFSAENVGFSPNQNPIANVSSTFADIDGTFVLDENVYELGFKLRKGSDDGDICIKYDVKNQLLVLDRSHSKNEKHNCIRTMKMELPQNREISLRVLLDSVVIEAFGNNGEAYISAVFEREDDGNKMELYVLGGNAVVKKLKIYQMKSIWIKDKV